MKTVIISIIWMLFCYRIKSLKSIEEKKMIKCKQTAVHIKQEVSRYGNVKSQRCVEIPNEAVNLQRIYRGYRARKVLHCLNITMTKWLDVVYL